MDWFDILMVVFWSVYVFFGWVYVWVHVDGCVVYVEVEYVEDIELFVKWFCVGLWWFVAYESDDFFLCSV
jgi:hypothetical protein